MLADKLFGLDVEVAEAVVTAENDLAAGLKRMEALHLDVSTLDRHFRGTVANLLRDSSSGVGASPVAKTSLFERD